MGIFDFLKKNQRQTELYSGGHGESASQAVIINADSSLIGVPAEYAYVEKACGKRDIDWKLITQMQTRQSGREYDVLIIEMKTGGKRTFWFDISCFFGKF